MLYPLLLKFFKPRPEKSLKNSITDAIKNIKIKESTIKVTCTDGFIYYKIVRSKVVFISKTSEFIVVHPEILIDAELSKCGGIFINEALFLNRPAIARWEILDSEAKKPSRSDFSI